MTTQETFNKSQELYQELIIQNVTLSANIKALCDKVDNLIEKGFQQCAVNNVRINSLEEDMEAIEDGSYPTCRNGKENEERLHKLLWGLIASILLSGMGITITNLIKI
jgi:putative SOS response-associated peptidase YedK